MRTNQRWLGLSVIVGLAGGMSSCASALRPLTAYPLPTSGPQGFVECEETVGGSVKDVDQRGDTLLISVPRATGRSRAHILTVPDNAVPDRTQFGLRNIGDDYVGVHATAYPDRAFNRPVTLRLSYAGCEGATNAGSLQMYRWEEASPKQWRWMPIAGTHNATEQWVEVDLTNLSEYALGAT